MIEPIPFAGLVDLSEPKTKYCSSCGVYRAETDGKIISTANKNIRRFKCSACINRVSAARFQGKKNATRTD
jgi:hypothetical protein